MSGSQISNLKFPNPALLLDGLTSTQTRVAGFVAAGFSNAEIAGIMGISEQTVKNHLQSIFDRRGMHSRLQLAIWAREQRGFAVLSDCPPADCRLPPADCRPAHRLEGRA
jgi:DNA-binding NarL/FixJ family response regulator